MFSISDNNTIVIGPCGSGKTSLLKDKIRKFQGSYIINDITGDIYADLSKELLDAGYKVKIIDFTKPLSALLLYSGKQEFFHNEHSYSRDVPD